MNWDVFFFFRNTLWVTRTIKTNKKQPRIFLKKPPYILLNLNIPFHCPKGISELCFEPSFASYLNQYKNIYI